MLDRPYKTPHILVTFLSLILWAVLLPPITLPQENPTTWEVCFSPHGECTNAIISELNEAKNSALVQAYSFTSAPIAKALLDAFKRGVKVEVILDKREKTQKSSKATFFFNAGIPTRIDAHHKAAHDKMMVVDGETVITGSFNFTNAAEKNNAENLLIIHDRKLAEKYVKNWQEHAQHSDVYDGNGERTKASGLAITQ